MEPHHLPLPANVRLRRLALVVLYLGAVATFRNLAPVLICFVIFERSLGWLSDELDRRTRLARKGALLTLLGVIVAALGGTVFYVFKRALPFVEVVREHGPEYLQELVHHPSVERLRSLAGLQHEPLSHVIKEHVGTALHYATGTAHIVIYLLIGFVLAVMFLFERDELKAWGGSIAADSASGTILRWFGYLTDAIAVTVKMQAVVAVVSAVVTLPVLLLLGLPQVPALFMLLLVCGLLPVVGNMIAGLVLCYVAYTAKGAWAVAVFVGVTFVLHKIESYYLNPKLAAEHVKLPGLVLVVSLLLFEQVFGFAGLFLSFPALYIATRIANEWRDAESQDRAPTPVEGA